MRRQEIHVLIPTATHTCTQISVEGTLGVGVWYNNVQVHQSFPNLNNYMLIATVRTTNVI